VAESAAQEEEVEVGRATRPAFGGAASLSNMIKDLPSEDEEQDPSKRTVFGMPAAATTEEEKSEASVDDAWSDLE